MFYKTILRRNTKNGPKLKVASVLEQNFPSANFPPVSPRDTPSIVNSSPAQTPLTDPRVWNRIDFQSDKIFKKRNQSTNKEQQITATAQIPSIATKNKISYNNKERKKRSEAEIDSRGDFQHRISPVKLSGGARRTRNEITYQKPKSRWGLVSVSRWGGIAIDRELRENSGRKIAVRLWKVCSVFSIYWYFCVRIK